MTFRIMASRHSAFYSPLLCAIQFLREGGDEATYRVLGAGQRSYALLRDGEVDIVQSAVSSNWNPRERGVEPLPVHFAQINQRDGFFLTTRQASPAFEWRQLEGRMLLADHGQQPLAMLKYAVRHNGANWDKIEVVDAGSPERMAAAFREGRGDYLHQQAPITAGEVVVAVGSCVPPVAFSSLCASRQFIETETFHRFVGAYAAARAWVQTAPAAEVARAEAGFFPGHSQHALEAAIGSYQKLGCWEDGLEIPRNLYEQALNVFETDGGLTRRFPYEEVCLPPR